MLQILHKSMILQVSIRNASSSTAVVTKIHRAIYPNMYKLVFLINIANNYFDI